MKKAMNVPVAKRMSYAMIRHVRLKTKSEEKHLGLYL